MLRKINIWLLGKIEELSFVYPLCSTCDNQFQKDSDFKIFLGLSSLRKKFICKGCLELFNTKEVKE